MIELWFITPAFRRFELTEICLEQRSRLCGELAKAGIRANCIVVAHDDNLATAKRYGFETWKMPNSWLGAKFSVGYTKALELGATHLMPIGSDSWMSPELLTALPFTDDACAGTRRLTTLRADGRERLDMRIEYDAGFGVATLYPRAAMDGVTWPCNPNIDRGCDTSTWNRTAREKGMPIDFFETHPLEYTDFKSYDEQVSDYRRLKHWAAGATAVDGDDAIDGLRELYDGDLVDALRDLYRDRPAWPGSRFEQPARPRRRRRQTT